VVHSPSFKDCLSPPPAEEEGGIGKEKKKKKKKGVHEPCASLKKEVTFKPTKGEGERRDIRFLYQKFSQEVRKKEKRRKQARPTSLWGTPHLCATKKRKRGKGEKIFAVFPKGPLYITILCPEREEKKKNNRDQAGGGACLLKSLFFLSSSRIKKKRDFPKEPPPPIGDRGRETEKENGRILCFFHSLPLS